MPYDLNPHDWKKRIEQQAKPLPPLSDDVDITNWTAVVTGANTGIGYEIARNIAMRGARTVILACRNEVKGRAAADALTRETGRPHGVIEYRHLDLASFASVRAFVQRYIEDRLPLHILVNNAGDHSSEKKLTEDGLDLLVQVNHISPLLLTLLLIPVLNGTAMYIMPPTTLRIIWVTSEGAELVSFPEVYDAHPVAALCAKQYSPDEALNHYFTTKLLNIMCARELLSRLFLGRIEVRGAVRVAAAYPGLVALDRWEISHGEARPRSVTLTQVRTLEEAAKTVLVPTLYDARKIWGQGGSLDMKSMPLYANMEIMEKYPGLAHCEDLRKKVYEDTVRLMRLGPGEVRQEFLGLGCG